MSEQKDSETAKSVIVIGAGASADFRGKNEEEILAEVRAFNYEERESGFNGGNHQFQKISKPKSKNQGFNMPTGEELIAKICDLDFLGDFFFRLFCKDNKIFDKKISQQYAIHESTSYFNSESSQNTYKVSLDKLDKDEQKDEVEKFIVFLKEKLSEKNESIHFRIYQEFKPYFTLSRLVSHYQPFSIDEFLDSIQNDKIDLAVLGQDAISNLDLDKKNQNPGQGENQSSKKPSTAEILVNAGKTLIALFLLLSEDKKLFNYNEGICWYRHLRGAIINADSSAKGIANKINGNDEEQDKVRPRNLTIISFNYDRSLDFFLRSRLGNFYKDIKVIYPYGELFSSDVWIEKKQTADVKEKEGDYQSIPYGSLKEKLESKKANNEAAKGISWDDFEKIKKLGAKIQVIGELKELVEEVNKVKEEITFTSHHTLFKEHFESGGLRYLVGSKALDELEQNKICVESIKKIKEHQHLKIFTDSILPAIEALQVADKIYFLGFAFHPQNCTLLGLEPKEESKSKQTKIFYTNYGNSEALEERREKYFEEKNGEEKNAGKRKIKRSQKGVYDALLLDFTFDFL